VDESTHDIQLTEAGAGPATCLDCGATLTVYVTYAIAFMSFAAIGLTLLKLTGIRGPSVFIFFAVPFVHMFSHVRGAYRLPLFSALWRTAMLVVLSFVAALMFFLALLTSGLLG
jgi:hypothetical protein